MPTRIALSSESTGSTIVPVLLIHGVNAVYVPAGVTFETITSGGDTAWWPGSGTVGVTYAQLAPHLRILHDGIEIRERVNPVSRTLDIGAITIGVDDPALAETAIFSQRDVLVQTLLTAELSASETTAISVVSTTGFQSAPADICIGREVIRYTGTTSTTFTGLSRARYGTVAARHPFATTTNSTLGTAAVYGGSSTYPVPVPSLHGRRATLWLAKLVGPVLTTPTLIYDGRIGAGTRLTESGAGWQLQIDHVSRTLAQPIRSRLVQIQGYVHQSNRGLDDAAHRRPTRYTPLVDEYVSGGSVIFSFALTDEEAAPHSGGYSPSREAYVDALYRLGSLIVSPPDYLRYSLDGTGRLRIETTFAASYDHRVYGIFTQAGMRTWTEPATTHHIFTSPDPMPSAWVLIQSGSRVFLGARDYAIVPAVPAAAGDSRNTRAYYTLVMGDGRDRRSARITARTTSGSPAIYYLTCDAIDVRSTDTLGGHLILEPTAARIGLHVQSDRWDAAIRYGLITLDAETSDAVSDAIDWDRIARSIDAAAPALGPGRQYLLDGGDSLLETLANEATIHGLALTSWYGRLAMALIAEMSSTERIADTISLTSPVGGTSARTEESSDDLCNSYKLTLPDGRVVIVADADSQDAFGPSRSVIAGVAPRGAISPAQPAEALYLAVFRQAAAVLGPWRYPYEMVTLRLPLRYGDLQIGDLVTVTDYVTPNRSRGRGLASATAQVIGRTLALYQEGHGGHIEVIARLNPPDVAGYAPSAFLSAANSGTGVCTLDTTLTGFAAVGFAQDETAPGTARTDGGANTFAVNDKVRLVELDNTSPTASTAHTVTAVSGATVTISPAPSATFATLAATPATVMLVYDDWEAATAAQKASGYAWIGERATLQLDSSTRAKRWAA